MLEAECYEFAELPDAISTMPWRAAARANAAGADEVQQASCRSLAARFKFDATTNSGTRSDRAGAATGTGETSCQAIT